MRRSRNPKKGKRKATVGSLKNIRINKGFVKALHGFTDDDEKEWGISWNKGNSEKMYIMYGDVTGVEFHPTREVNIHTHHGRVISQPSAVDLANVIDAREMVSIITTPYGLHIFRKGTEDRRTNYKDALEITNTWINDDYTVDDIDGKMGEFGIEYAYMSWKEAKENGIDIDDVFIQDRKK